MTIPRTVKVYAKTIAVFVAGVVISMVTDLAKGSKPWPQNGSEWLQYVLTSFGTAATALVVRNKITQKQIDKDPDVVGGVVVDDPVNKGLVEHQSGGKVIPVRPTENSPEHDTPFD